MPQQRIGAILLRVSTKEQAEEGHTTYKVQVQDCERYARENDIIVPPDHIWQEVAKRDDYYTRDGLQAALAAAEHNRYQALIVWRIDRLTDDVEYFLKILRILKDHNALPWSVKEPEIDCRTQTGINLAITKIMWQVQPERSTTALRTQSNRRYNTEHGRPWASHSPRYGYTWVVNMARTRTVGDVPIPLKERLEPDPDTAPVVVRMYEWIDTGRTTAWIARALSGDGDDGIHKQPSPRDHARIGGANPKGRWEEGTVRRMLKFPGYMGRWPAYTTKRVKIPGTERYKQVAITPEEWVWITPPPAPALISGVLWQRVQTRIAANAAYAARNSHTPKAPERALLHTGMARCGQPDPTRPGGICGSPLAVFPRGYIRADGSTAWGYRCTRSHRHKTDCPGVVLDARKLDWGVWSALLDVLRTPDALRRFAQREWLRAHPDEAGVKVVTPADILNDAQHRVATLTADINTWVDRLQDPRLDPDNLLVYDQRVTQLRAQLKTATAEMSRLRGEADEYQQAEETIGTWEDYLRLAKESVRYTLPDGRLYSPWPDAPEVQRRWLEALGARVFVTSHTAARLELHLTRLGPARPGEAAGPDAVTVPVIPSPPPAPRQLLPPVTPRGDQLAETGGTRAGMIARRQRRAEHAHPSSADLIPDAPIGYTSTTTTPAPIPNALTCVHEQERHAPDQRQGKQHCIFTYPHQLASLLIDRSSMQIAFPPW
jgi:DNA invertase Pin-like site-specific DNA recombinase